MDDSFEIEIDIREQQAKAVIHHYLNDTYVMSEFFHSYAEVIDAIDTILDGRSPVVIVERYYPPQNQ